MLIAQGLDPTVFPPFSPLAANPASMEGFLLGGFDALANSLICIIHVDLWQLDLEWNAGLQRTPTERQKRHSQRARVHDDFIPRWRGPARSTGGGTKAKK
jgi:hypothetical protein